MSTGDMGSGSGRGGGSGGTIRDAGGAFGKREQAFEDQYFMKLNDEQLKHLHDSLEEEIRYHTAAIERHAHKLAELKKITAKKHS
jgi:hypothetical protein